MTRAQVRRLDRELREYMDSMVEGMGRRERRRALQDYLAGLLLDGERKKLRSDGGPAGGGVRPYVVLGWSATTRN